MSEPVGPSGEAAPVKKPKKRGSSVTWLILLAIFAVIFYTQFTLFVIKPIGAIPEGKTLLILRLNKGEFIDSADAMCERIQGGVNLLCRLAVMAAIAKNGIIIARLPYVESLYLISTGGKEYDR